jgi:uncharacterized membrane protein
VGVASPGAQRTTVRRRVSLPVHALDSGGAALSYSASGLPAGLSISPTTGVISGTPTTVQIATVTVAASDHFRNVGSTAFSWTVVKPAAIGKPRTRSVKFSGLGKGKPKLTFTIDAGSHAPALKSVSVSLPRGLSFARKTKTLDKGIGIRSGGRKVKFRLKLSKGVPTISFKSSVRTASLSIGTPAISVSGSEASKIRNHKVKKLTVSLKTTDTSHKTVKLGLTLKKLS